MRICKLSLVELQGTACNSYNGVDATKEDKSSFNLRNNVNSIFSVLPHLMYWF